MDLREKFRTSYIYSFIFQSLLMFALMFLFNLIKKSEVDYLQLTLSSIIYGAIMSWFLINAIKNKERNSGK